MNKFTSDNYMIGTLPWGGMVIVCSRGTTDDVPRSARSTICSGTSAGASCGWGTGRGGDFGGDFAKE